ncbi:hypothetical protein Gogos_002180 [Gossypium gossypioides]|uniref:Reverse transcriptase zinc-binding domain-containing protein n=1 Tax=Gossypium gossypioides TaxID=34282 RepID=A0A7J9CR76_GOSGO|nr:hypothetical protein [Gossypium gossypioides]
MHICEDGCETLEHVFQDCVTTKEVWGRQRSIIIGAIRAIWTSRNRVLHERHNQPVQEILEMVKKYTTEWGDSFPKEHKRIVFKLVVRSPDRTVVTHMGVDLGLQRVEIEGDAHTIIKKANINRRDELERANVSVKRSVIVCKEENRGGGNLNRLVKNWGKIRLKGYLGENNDQFFEKLKWK